ncbi:MAG: MFS transporter [Promethearchaeota archaeon]
MKKLSNQQEWQFWPIIFLAFFYPINNALINLAIPLYFFQQGINIELIGILAAGVAITYAFSPILFSKLSNRIGRKKSVILGISGAFCAQIIFYISLNPIPFLIARMMEGFFMGFYWTNLQSSISDNSLHDHSKMMSRYNISWNSGLLTGYLIGAIFLFVIDAVVLIFYFAPLFLAVNVFIAIFFFQESNKINLKDGLELKIRDNNEFRNQDEIKLTNYYIPLIIPILFVAVFGLAKASVGFLYPIKSETLGFETYTAYLLTFFCIVTQLIGTGTATFFSIKNLKRVPIICLFSLIFILIFYGITSDFFVFIILFLFLGYFTGLLYGFSLKLVLILNMKNHTSKYSGLLESVIGTMFLITPIALGFVARMGFDTAFYIISIVLLGIFIYCLINIKKIAELKE